MSFSKKGGLTSDKKISDNDGNSHPDNRIGRL